MDMGFAAFRPLAPCRRPLHPVLVHRLAPLLHASFRPRLATKPLRFTIPSPPSGWEEDFHLQAVEHARHTKKVGALAPANKLHQGLKPRSLLTRYGTSEQAAEKVPGGICEGSTFPQRIALHR